MGIFLEKIEKQASMVLDRYNIKTLPIPVEEITMNLSIKISRAPSSDFSGILIRKNDKALIGINSNENLKRQRFTIAHELGHFFLHREKDTFIDYRKETKTPREIQANMFAAALLMPRNFLLKDLKQIITQKNIIDDDNIKDLSEKYNVSEEAMRIRILNLKTNI